MSHYQAVPVLTASSVARTTITENTMTLDALSCSDGRGGRRSDVIPSMVAMRKSGATEIQTRNVVRQILRALGVLSLSIVSPLPAAHAIRPNVIVVMTDDQGYGDLSANGNPVLRTPNLDQLAAESIRLTDFHVAPMCTPTRGQLMSGRHALPMAR